MDAAAVAAVRWLWRAGERGETGPQRDDCIASFTTWVVEHLDSHIPLVRAHTAGSDVRSASAKKRSVLVTLDAEPRSHDYLGIAADVGG